MSSGFLKRSERYRLAGVLLRIRVAAYVAVGALVLLPVEAPLSARIAVSVFVALGASAPLILRRRNRYAGVRFSAVIDLVASYVLWLAVPWADGLSLALTAWAVALVTFLNPAKNAVRITLIAIGLELSKVGALAAGVVSHDVGAPSVTTGIGILLARTLVLVGVYLLIRSIGRYLRLMADAAESGSARYRRLVDGAPTSYLVAVDLEIAYANPAAGDLFRQPHASLVGRTLSDLVRPGDRDRLVGAMEATTDWFEPVQLESVRLDVGGEDDLWADVTCTVVDYRGELAVQVAFVDRSGQRRAEIDLYRTEVDYHEFFERIPVALYRSLPDGTITQANTALLELLGVASEDELQAFDAPDFYADVGDREYLGRLLDDAEVIVGFETRMRRADGETIWVRDTSRQITTEDGVIYEGAMVDITAQRALEEELWSRASQQEAAATIGQIALESGDIASELGDVTGLICRVLGADGVAVLRRSGEGDVDLTGFGTGIHIAAESVAAIADRAHMTGAPVVLRTEAEVRFEAPLLADRGVQSCVAMPVPGVEVALGTLIVVTDDVRLFSADDINFLLSVANVLAAAIDRSEANEKLEELVRSKDAFIASVSHELRTPLTVVAGMALELNERWRELSDEELGEFTAMLVEQSRDMSDLIDDLLVAARSNMGNVTVRQECVNLESEIDSVLGSFLDTGQSTVTVRAGAGDATADPIRVRQIIRNLVTNAFRYGGPNIEVTTSSEQGMLAIEVIDDGDGIRSENHDRIFTAYERAHHAVGQPGSVGLGLTISRTLAELMGGSLTYRFDGRSVFRLELPRVADESTDPPPPPRISGDDLTPDTRTGGPGRFGV